MKSIKKLENIIEEHETIVKSFVLPLCYKIKDYIHGNEELNTVKHINNLKEIIQNYNAKDFTINNITFYEDNIYNFDPKKSEEITGASEYNDWRFIIYLDVKGLYEGNVTLSISSGTKGWSKPIYYFEPNYFSSIKIDFKQIKDLKNSLDKLLRSEFINSIINLAFKDSVYLDYSDNYNTYEIWDSEPREYNNSICGGYSSEIDKKMISNLKKIINCNNIEDYASKNMYGEEKEITWTEFKL